MQRTDAIAKLKESRASWDILIASVPDDLFETPLWEDGWTLKSIVAHVDFYEWWVGEFMVKRDWPEVDPRLNTWDVDERNRVLNEINQARPLAEVLADSPVRHLHLLNALENLSDEEFDNPELLGQGNQEEDWALATLVAGHGVDHYEQHAPQIRAWLESIS